MGHKVLIIGPGGGREAALAWKFKQDGDQVFTTNPNGGFDDSEIAKGADGKALGQFDYVKLKKFARENAIELAVVAGDDVLAKDMVTKLRRDSDLKVFGPTAAAAKLESSKVFAKRQMTEANVPTAPYKVFKKFSPASTHVFARSANHISDSSVVKADGLAQGKGVKVAKSPQEAVEALEKILVHKKFGDAGKQVVIEDLLEGKEFSAHALVDKNGNSVMFPLVADYKPALDGDKGDNTGGMGVVGFLEKGSSAFLEQIKTTIVDPIIAQMKKIGKPFMGLLYPGLMQKENEQPQVLEYNARFGDPETQVYMRLLDDNCKLFDVLDACVTGTLNADTIKWKEGEHAVSVTLASVGYPGKYPKEKEITGIDEAEKISGVKVFHAGTKIDETTGKLVTSGGRVLHVTATGSTLKEAREKAYQAVDKINFEGKTYRTDIGEKGTRE